MLADIPDAALNYRTAWESPVPGKWTAADERQLPKLTRSGPPTAQTGDPVQLVGYSSIPQIAQRPLAPMETWRVTRAQRVPPQRT